MKRQTVRRAHLRASLPAAQACALALLAGCTASAQEPRFEGQWLVEYKTEEGKTSLTERDHGITPDFRRRPSHAAAARPPSRS